jgi:hypothetical protein
MKTQIKPSPLQDYLSLSDPITLYPEPDGGYTVMLADLPGCISQGDTLEEAVVALLNPGMNFCVAAPPPRKNSYRQSATPQLLAFKTQKLLG